jgi:1-acyl-sn-glycerol-3-phosphate acyltransferase
MADHPLLKFYWYECCRRPIYVAARLAYRARYTGVENIPKEGAVLMVSNHQSHFDPPFVGSGCPRQMNFLARDTLFTHPIFGKLLRSVNAIPIDREGGGLAGIKETLRRLKRGEAVLVFPEGTRSPDGEIRPFLPGFTALAVRGNATIVPAAIEGAFDAWPRWRRFPSLGVVHIHYGHPIPPNQVERLEERALVAEVERRVRQCQALLRARPVFASRRGG